MSFWNWYPRIFERKKIGQQEEAAVIDKEELPENPNMGDPEKENIEDPALEKKRKLSR